MWCKMEFFGEGIEAAGLEGEKRSTKGPRNMLELLPEEFTLADAIRVRRAEGKNAEGTRDMLWQWVHRGYTLQLTVDSYKKLKYQDKK